MGQPVKQKIYMRDRIDLKDMEHDYQRMRKLAKKRRNGILNNFNKERAVEEKRIRGLLGAEAWVEARHSWVGKVVWIGVGLLVGLWLGGR
jgi:hypothetical protein